MDYTNGWSALELMETRGGPAGRISLGDIEVNPDGALQADRHLRCGHARLDPFVLAQGWQRHRSLRAAQRVGDRAELVLVATEELKRQLEAGNIPIPKPIRLKRVPG
jgi:hypothetical protein